MNKLDKKILLDLFKSPKGLFPFTFHSRYGITPGKIFSFIKLYEDKKLIEFKDKSIKITEEGKKYILKNKWSIRETNPFERIPPEFIVNKLGVNEFYIPNKSEVDPDILSL